VRRLPRVPRRGARRFTRGYTPSPLRGENEETGGGKCEMSATAPRSRRLRQGFGPSYEPPDAAPVVRSTSNGSQPPLAEGTHASPRRELP